MAGKGLLAAGLVATALAAFAGSASGAVTIGSNLQATEMANFPGCTIPCTAVNLVLPPSSLEPGGLTSPVNGTVTSWRVRANTGPNLQLRVLRPAGTLTFTGAGRSAPAGFAGPGPSDPIPTSLPIRVGDSIGLDNPDTNLVYAITPGRTIGFWNMGGPLPEGVTRTLDGTGDGKELLLQATIEPANTLTFGAPILNKKKGTATVTVTAPNAGQLTYAGAGASVTGPASVPAPGDFQLTVRATGKKAKKLKKKGKAGVAFTATFTPNGGTAGVSNDSLTLRKKLKKK